MEAKFEEKDEDLGIKVHLVDDWCNSSFLFWLGMEIFGDFLQS